MSIVRSLSSTPPTLRSLDLFRLRLLTRRGTQGQAKAEVGAAERPPESNQMATVGGVSAVPWTFLSEIPQLATNEGAKPRRTRMSIVRSLSSTPTTLRHQATAAAVVAPLHPFVPPPNDSAHLSCAASGDLPDGELRAKRKPKESERYDGTSQERYADVQPAAS